MAEKNVNQTVDETEEKVLETENCDCAENPKQDEAQEVKEAERRDFKKDKKEKKAKKSAIEQKLEETENKLRETSDSLLRLRADFDNYRKRNAQLRTDSLSEGRASVIEEILKPLDNFERAISVECTDKNYADGMKMIYNMMFESLRNMGVEEIVTEGLFDPNVHEAVMQEEQEGVETGTILTVFQKGYMFNGKVLRPAMVKVAK